MPQPDWDQQLIDLGGHFLQSSHWGRFEQAQGRQVLQQQGDGWMWQAVLRLGRGGVRYLYSPYGPTFANFESRITNQGFESLIAAGREHKADFVKAEPWGAVQAANGWTHVKDFQPSHIMRLDITATEDELRKNISQSNRNLINQAQSRGLSLQVGTDQADFDVFLSQQKDTAKRAGFTMHADKYYRTLFDTLKGEVLKIYRVQHADGVVASAMCFDFGGVRYYAHAGTDDALNRQHKGAIVLLWWLIADAKAKGLTAFDYGGVAPEDQPNHPWAGHTRFKQSVGGQIIKLAGTWDYPIKPAKYKIYRAAKKFLG